MVSLTEKNEIKWNRMKIEIKWNRMKIENNEIWKYWNKMKYDIINFTS